MKYKALSLFFFSLLIMVHSSAAKPASGSSAQQGLIVIPAGQIVVAPNQPAVLPNSTVGIINALCDVKLYILSCPFFPTSGEILCDTNGDGIPELSIPLKNVRSISSLLVEATIPPLSPQLPGTAFPLACCGGIARLVLLKRVGAGDDNIFGEYTLKASCPIDLGLRAPVVISASPSGGDCAIGQNLQVPGACFLLEDGKPNVTAVFAVEVGNPANVIQATRFVILNNFLIDAFFQIGAANAGKSFLIYASGPNGTSRNLTTLPQGAAATCPLGNEQGVQVTFTCNKPQTTPDPPAAPKPTPSPIVDCRLERTDSGTMTLMLTTTGVSRDAEITIGGVKPKSLKFKEPDTDNPAMFHTVIVKGKMCKGLPGMIVVKDRDEKTTEAFACNQTCDVAMTMP